MKKILAVLALSLVSTTSFAASIEGAKVIEKEGENFLSIDVRYGGGCKEHKFVLELGSCLESLPVQCGAELKDLTTDDFCRALISTTVEISFEEAGLNDSYFSGGSLGISGDNETRASVRLPVIR